MDRRSLLRAGATGVVGIASARTVAACSPRPGATPTTTVPPSPVDPVWDCGVASGLHASDAAVLWTRVAPGALGAVPVTWHVATDPGFSTVVAAGSSVASPEGDGTVKVLAEGLDPASTYWYRFSVDGSTSPVGRTKTPAAPGTTPERVRVAVASCQSWTSGYYPAWGHVAAEDLDVVVHVGDYIYEGGGGLGSGVRPDTVGVASDLASYRAKYRLYRSDPALRAAHAAHAFAPVWDDHEFVNDFDRLTILERPARWAAAHRAWFEYQPVWPIGGTRIHRRARFGDLVDLSLLDTRQYRDPPPEGGKQLVWTHVDPGREVHRAGRTILGSDQRQWLLDGLGEAEGDGVTWKLLGNQVMVAPMRAVDLDEPLLRFLDPELPRHAGLYVNADAWDGFQWERDELCDFLAVEGVGGTAFLTGDMHSFWQAPLRRDLDDDGSPVVAQEFTCGSVSSTTPSVVGDLADSIAVAAAGSRPGFRYVDLRRRGVGVVECRPDSMEVQFRVADATSPNGAVRTGTRFAWAAGTSDVTMTVG
jgi:alkaline phosphatase D